MDAKLVELEHMTITGVGGPFISNLLPDTNASKVIPGFWDGFISRCGELELTCPDVTYGAITGCVDLNTMHYVAGAQVEPDASTPEGMETVVAPAGKYALYTHRGPIWELATTTHKLYREWLPKSGLTVRDAPHLELYDSRFNPGSPHSELDILIPVV